MNETIKLLMNHRSIRKYADRPVERSVVEQVIAAGQMASTSSNMQAYSVIAITNQEHKRRLAEACDNQPSVKACPVFLVWCADLARLKQVTKPYMAEGAETYEDTAENFIIATIDAALAAQNAAVAAESLGLGIVCIGDLQEHMAETAELLKLPELVYPIFGMCLGYPAQDPILRPRLPQDEVLHWETYSAAGREARVARYDQQISDYLNQRTKGQLATPWSEYMVEHLAAPKPLQAKKFLEKQGFFLR